MMAEGANSGTMLWEARLRSVYGAMGEAERKVAAYFQEKAFDLLVQPISQIAQSLQVSEATVVRFCRHVGFSGLKEFKIALAKEQSSAIRRTQGLIQWGDDMEAVKSKVFAGSMQVMGDSLALLDVGELQRAVKALRAAKYIDVYGLGGSVPIADYMRHQFMKIGVRTNLFVDAQSQHLSLSQITGEDVVVAISCSGETGEIVNAARWARGQGCTTIAITSHPRSSLAQAADILLLTAGGPFFLSGRNTLSRFAQLAVVNVLYVGIGMEMGREEVEEVSQRAKTARRIGDSGRERG